MSLRKRNPSRVVEKAQNRLRAVELIDVKYGTMIEYSGGNNTLTYSIVSKKILEYRTLIEDYNIKLEEADLIGNTIAKAEQELSDMYTTILAGAKSRFGLDSDEVKILGGTRKSERKKPFRKNIS
ncbi:MAG: hypothetical protein IAE91_13980 [Ignavibacteriaceae bacterium]|nr:hypothetical protein [Ignavibacteriaceae bacterium]